MSVEILAPAGNRESFNAAINAGANAIYIGLNEFSARKGAENFSVDNLEQVVGYAHLFDAKVYVAVNTLVKDSELEGFFDIIAKAYSKGADAFILQDMFLGKLLKQHFPDICLHLSTQAGVCNEYGAILAKEFGFDRVILARETAYEDIKKIASIIEVEAFVQGALCSSFSGHCYISSFAGGMSGNRGYCKQPCRKKYIYSGKGFKPFAGYNLSLSDLCLKDRVNDLISAGISSFKIEGRMRSPEYVFSAVKVYKDALSGVLNEENFKHLKRSFNRGNFTEGYINADMRGIISSKIQGNIGDFVGKISRRSPKGAIVETKEIFSKNDGFKILRNCIEIGSAGVVSSSKCELTLSNEGKLCAGDDVYITKDSVYAEYVSKQRRLIDLTVELHFYKNKRAKCVLKCKDVVLCVESDDVLAQATNAPISAEVVQSVFKRVGEYPFNVVFSDCEIEDVFAPRSVLNEFRRKCFSVIYSAVTNCSREARRTAFLDDSFKQSTFISDVKNEKITLIISDISTLPSCGFSRFIYKPSDYSNVDDLNRAANAPVDAERFLYLPPFATGRDLQILERAVKGFDGVYAEGYYGIFFARIHGKKLLCGTGLNIFNSRDAFVAKSLNGGAEFVFSKEMSYSEVKGVDVSGGVLALGNVQVMDLIYCPFSHECASCRRDDIYALKDEGGRSFTVRRYKMSSCRFEVYNPFDLVSDVSKISDKVYDCTLLNRDVVERMLKARDVNQLKSILPEYTSGSLNRGIK